MRKILICLSLCLMLGGCAKQSSSNEVVNTVSSTTTTAIATATSQVTTTMATTTITTTPVTTTQPITTTTTIVSTTKPVTTTVTTAPKATIVTTTTNLTQYYAMHGWIYNEDDDTFYPTEEKKDYYRQWYGKTISEVEKELNTYISMQGPWGESIGLNNFKNAEIGSCFAIVDYKGHKLQFPF